MRRHHREHDTQLIIVSPFVRFDAATGTEPAPLDANPEGGAGLGAALIGWLRAWWRRERERRELAAMGVRDFGDLTVPPGLVREEARLWPWQKSSPQWAEVAADRQEPDEADGSGIHERRATALAKRGILHRRAPGGDAARVGAAIRTLS
jgi:uncharacterized protein YjiS (DUF1127 family)